MDENRRKNARHTVEGKVFYRSGHGVFCRGQLIDVSESGVGLMSSEPMPSLPEQVAFRLDGMPPVLFYVKPAWHTEQNGTHRMGLEILPVPAACDDRCLRRWLTSRPSAEAPRKRGRSARKLRRRAS
ncbi:MAG: PilZ domain-containing protein [Candidatus Eremiobacterota bacterium]